MGNPSKRDVLTRKLQHYLVLHEQNPHAFPLTQDAVARYEDKALGFRPCSRTTLKTHGLSALIKDHKEHEPPSTKRPPSKVERRVIDATSEVQVWRARYEATVRKLRLIEHHLRRHRHVDLDEIYASEMPLPDRAAPAPSGRSTRAESERRPRRG